MAGQDNNQGWSDDDKNDEQVPYPRSVVVSVCLLLVGIGVLSVWQMGSRLRLDIPTFGSGAGLKEISQSILEQQDEQLRLQDSDQDGLSDYDELRVYATSPFIADSDSDGINDAAEVKAGTNPNCPPGGDCQADALAGAPQNTGASPYVTDDVKNLLQDPKALRNLLIAAGADAELVAKLDDQTVQILAQQSLQDISGPTPEKIETLKGLPVEQIRGILRQFGMTEEDISALTDEEVQKIYNEALAQFEAKTPTP
ncbi:MAG: hypothetical protein HY461_03340 [Parcubacteria group bacterium]|nr:hypothetical protein [Parcubacteria group bacterium]